VVAPQFSAEVILQLDKDQEVPKAMMMDTGRGECDKPAAWGVEIPRGVMYAAYTYAGVPPTQPDALGKIQQSAMGQTSRKSISLGMPGIASSGNH